MDQRVIWWPALCRCELLLILPPMQHPGFVIVLHAIIVPWRLSILCRHRTSGCSVCLHIAVLLHLCSSGPEPDIEVLSAADCEVARHLASACKQVSIAVKLRRGSGIWRDATGCWLRTSWEWLAFCEEARLVGRGEVEMEECALGNTSVRLGIIVILQNRDQPYYWK
jgi:hypothetical protein